MKNLINDFFGLFTAITALLVAISFSLDTLLRVLVLPLYQWESVLRIPYMAPRGYCKSKLPVKTNNFEFEDCIQIREYLPIRMTSRS